MTETPAGYYTDADAIRMALGKHGDVIDEGDLVMMAQEPIMAPDERKETESMEGTTQAEKSDSRADNGAAMGIAGAGCLGPLSDLDNACPTEVASHEHVGCSASETRPPDDFHEPQAKKLAAAISLLMSELPGLLEDREKLRKLREVLA